MHKCLLPFVAVLLVLLLTAAAQDSPAPGAVVGLAGTPHLWIADDQGVLHWGGDTRALAGRYVNWGNRRDVSLAELQTFPIGDPWLSAGLLKQGDPIYLVKWESDWEQPMLLHIQSIKDVEFLGINSSNYGKFVLDTATWEARYGQAVATLERAELAAVVTPDPDGTRVVPAVTPEDATLTSRQRRSGQPSRRSDEMPAPTRTAEPPRLVSTPTPTQEPTIIIRPLTRGEWAVLDYEWDRITCEELRALLERYGELGLLPSEC